MRKDEDLINDCLVSEKKQLCSTLSTAVTEAATPNVRNEFQQTLSNCFCTQDEVYKEMTKKKVGIKPKLLDKIKSLKLKLNFLTNRCNNIIKGLLYIAVL